ncbi:MAG: hypothetical protein NT010_09720 [Proteobacteria bacterium]|nr:hypothetical protein [Pseudomonadota bacterium]
MEVSNKITVFNTFGKTLHNTLNDDVFEKPVSIEEDEALDGKARDVLNDWKKCGKLIMELLKFEIKCTRCATV